MPIPKRKLWEEFIYFKVKMEIKKLTKAILHGMFIPFGGCLFQIVLPGLLISYFFCNIETGQNYGWFSGFWHGIFIPINIVRSLFFNVLYKADSYTLMYNVIWWIMAVSWIYTIPRLLLECIKDTIKCYKYGPDILYRGY